MNKRAQRLNALTTRRVTLASSDLARAKAAYKTSTPGKYAVMGVLRDTIKAQSLEIATLRAQLALRVTARIPEQITAVKIEKWPLIEVEDIGQPLDSKWIFATA